jgi:hypothetical protein
MKRLWLHWLAVVVALLMPLEMVLAAPVIETSATMNTPSHCDDSGSKQPDRQPPAHCAMSCSVLPAPDAEAFEPRPFVSAVPAAPLVTVLLAGTDLEPVPPPPRAW